MSIGAANLVATSDMWAYVATIARRPDLAPILADVRKEALHTAATAIRLIAGLPNVKQEARP